MSEQTVKCPICGQPYKVYMYYAGDQSACPTCRLKAKIDHLPYRKERHPFFEGGSQS